MSNKFRLVTMLMALVMLGSLAMASTTVTNRGEVITVQTLTDTVTDTKKVLEYKDESIYPAKPGDVGKIIRWYDFGVHGGAVGAKNLLPDINIPKGLLVRNGYIKVVTGVAPVGDTVTNALSIVAANDVFSAATNSWSTTGMRAVVPVGTATTALSITSAKPLVYTTSGSAAITAGKFMVVLDVEYSP